MVLNVGDDMLENRGLCCCMRSGGLGFSAMVSVLEVGQCYFHG